MRSYLGDTIYVGPDYENLIEFRCVKQDVELDCEDSDTDCTYTLFCENGGDKIKFSFGFDLKKNELKYKTVKEGVGE